MSLNETAAACLILLRILASLYSIVSLLLLHDEDNKGACLGQVPFLPKLLATLLMHCTMEKKFSGRIVDGGTFAYLAVKRKCQARVFLFLVRNLL